MFRRRMIGLLASVALAVAGAGVMALPASAAAPPMPMVATVESAAVAAPAAGIAARVGVAPAATSTGPLGCTKAPTIPVGPGSTGPSVRYLQCILNGMYFGGSYDTLGPTGNFGALTAKAVRAYKLYAFGSASDTIVGPTTWTRLIITAITRGWEVRYAPTFYGCPPAASPVLTQGSRGASVVMLQCLLGMRNVDGIFGLQTWNAVIAFKAQVMGAPHSDGIVGPGTWNELLWTCECGGP